MATSEEYRAVIAQIGSDVGDAHKKVLAKGGSTSQPYLVSKLSAAIDTIPGPTEPVLQNKTVTPSTSQQTVKPDSGYDGLSQVTVNAMPTATQATPSISVSNGGLITASATQTAGYVNAGTQSATQQLTAQAGKTVTPGTSDQTAVASGRYTTGEVKVKGDANLAAENIKSGVNIFGVLGTFEGSGGGSDGGANLPVSRKDVNFYDYDGTLLHSFTLEEANALTALPPEPTHDGLLFQKWNYTLDSVKRATRKMDVGATYTTADGKTRIYIHLEEGRTSPMLGVCPNGTVDVDWGDGTAHDTLAGTSTSTVKWTPNHEYAAPGDYVITLAVDGAIGLSGSNVNDQYSNILRHTSSGDPRNRVYQNAITAFWVGDSVTSVGSNAFDNCPSLSSLVIPDSVTSVGNYAFRDCPSLSSLVIPDSVTSFGNYAFRGCSSLSSLAIPDGVTSIGDYAFYNCSSLSSLVIPDSVTRFGNYAIYDCSSLSSLVIPDSVTSIGNNAFNRCRGVRFFDFTRCSSVPSLSNTNAFTSIPEDCEIRVPAVLYDEWIAATNWSTYAERIVAL